MYSNTDQPGPFNASITVHFTVTSKPRHVADIAAAIGIRKEIEKRLKIDRTKLIAEMCCDKEICRKNEKGEEEMHRNKVENNTTVEWVGTT